MPRILGHEIAGIVLAVGKNAKNIAPGTHVQVYPGISCGSCRYCRQGFDNMCEQLAIMGFNYDGGFSAYLKIPVRSLQAGALNLIPKGIGFAEATLARHGARAITSSCGTIDMLEALGVDVECEPQTVVKSIEQAGVGIFNGMSPRVHPMALGRILSNISFGTVLNVAASLANPALPAYGVRGVYSPALMQMVPQLMREIGYKRALVVNGLVEGSTDTMDEASTLGETLVAELQEDGSVKHYSFYPDQLGIKAADPDLLRPSGNLRQEAAGMVALLTGKGCPTRSDIAALNAGLILYITKQAKTIKEGYHLALEIIRSGECLDKLADWVRVQNSDPEAGLARLYSYMY